MCSLSGRERVSGWRGRSCGPGAGGGSRGQGGGRNAMRQRASGPEGPDGPGSCQRSAAGMSTGSSQQAQAGRGPFLDAAQLEVLRRYGSEHDFAAGDVLFADGDVSYDLIVVLAGRVQIIERRGQPGERVMGTYGASQ